MVDAREIDAILLCIFSVKIKLLVFGQKGACISMRRREMCFKAGIKMVKNKKKLLPTLALLVHRKLMGASVKGTAEHPDRSRTGLCYSRTLLSLTGG